MKSTHSIDLHISNRLRDPQFRREWFRAELETTVPNLFRMLREKRNLTQSALASLTGMMQSAISRFEISTDAKWKFETLQRMADALDSRLYIGLEPAEDVIARVEREEKLATAPRRSAADRSADDSPKEIVASALTQKDLSLMAQKVSKLPTQRPMNQLKKETQLWN